MAFRFLRVLFAWTQEWEDEFEQFDQHQFREFENHWREAEENQWTDEFERVQDQLSDKIAYSRYLDSLSDEQAKVNSSSNNFVGRLTV